MDYESYLVACHDQSLPVAYEKFHWQQILPRQENIRGLAASCRDGSISSRRHRQTDVQVQDNRCETRMSVSCYHFASADLESAFDSIKSALSLRLASADELSSTRSADKVNMGVSSSQGDASTTSKTKGKKVSFADEAGLALTHVRIIYDSFSSYLSMKTSAYSVLARRQPISTQRFMVNFLQPWKCKDSFREKLAGSNVLLGNLIIKDNIICGEIEARNIAYEKTVFVRYTASQWNYHSDVQASYVTHLGTKFPGYDTFSFQFTVPLDPEKSGRLEFAIYYIVNGETFWDNNCGKNYEVIAVTDEKANLDHQNTKPHEVSLRNTTDRIVFSVLQTTSFVWTEFTGWKWGMDYSLPYW